MKYTSHATRTPARGFLAATLTVAALLVAVQPIAPAKVRAAANAYDWLKHEDHDLMGGGYTSVASSADGSRLIMSTTDGGEGYTAPSPLYVSDDYGATWEDINDDIDEGIRNYWTSVDISNNGQVMVAASNSTVDLGDFYDYPGKLFVSQDGGGTWENVTPNASYNWDHVVVSGNGNTIVALSDDDQDTVYKSTNGGNTWTTSTVTDMEQWHTLSISDDGTKILVGGESENDLGALIYASTNSGSTWTDVVNDTGVMFSLSTAMSADGDKMAYAVHAHNGSEYDKIYISQNNGAAWTDISPDDADVNEWSALAMSDDGSVLAALEYGNKMYVSADSGAEWTEENPGSENNDNNSWRAVDSNASGSRLVAASSSMAYTGYNAGLDNDEPASNNTATIASAETGKAITLTTPDGTTITCNTSVKEAALSGKDGQYEYPVGLVDFCFSTEESANDVVLVFATDLKPEQVVARKYNPLTKAYAQVPGATITQTTLNGQAALRVAYTIVDNGPLDVDPDVGEIADPVGLAVAATPGTPNTGIEQQNTGVIAATAGVSAIVLLSYTAAPAYRKLYSKLKK